MPSPRTNMTGETYLKTGFILDRNGRVTSTREPGKNAAPIFTLIRDARTCIWAIRADVPSDIANALARLASDEKPGELEKPPQNADRYKSLVTAQVEAGPAFTFPKELALSTSVIRVDDVHLLEKHFSGWTSDEIPFRAPILALSENGYPISVCFCARRSDEAAEAGVETAAAFRGRGLAFDVTTAWAAAIRACGLTPLYSTSWDNKPSLSLARKLGLFHYASFWSLVDE